MTGIIRHETLCWYQRGASLLLLAAGAAIYLLFRPLTLLLFKATDALSLGSIVGHWRQSASAWQPADFMVYSLPDGLWAASYVLLADSVTAGYRPRVRILAASIIPLVGASAEVMQAFRLLPGTYDTADLLCFLLPLLLNTLLICQHSFPANR